MAFLKGKEVGGRWGVRVKICMVVKAHSALHGQPKSVHIINSPWGLIFIAGAQKEWKMTFDEVMPDFCGVE